MTERQFKLPHLHPVPVHFPQALFPAAFVALLIHLFANLQEFETASYIMFLFALVSTPLTIASGFADWKLRFKGQMTRVFRIKIIGAILLLLCSMPAVLLRMQHPEITVLPLGWPGWLYLGLLTLCQLDCAVVGYYGGRLVFH
jgi:uncharacterized membrane protein